MYVHIMHPQNNSRVCLGENGPQLSLALKIIPLWFDITIKMGF